MNRLTLNDRDNVFNYYEKKFLCVIPARAGSKGIKNKNSLLNNKPLIQYTIDTKKIRGNCQIVVSTDCQKVRKIIKK